jgi:hypothetical protein
LAPRHPPRALCSLTSLSNSPRGKCQEKVRDHITLSLITAEIEDHQFLITSSLVKVPPPKRRPQGLSPPVQLSAGRCPRTCRLETTDQGIALVDTHRRLEVSRAVGGTAWILRVSPGSTRYSVGCSAFGAGFLPRYWPLDRGEVVETRRLELLTLSLQRRCSSN